MNSTQQSIPISGFNLPIMEPFTGYRSLEAFKSAVNSTSQLHMTHVFLKASNNFLSYNGNQTIKTNINRSQEIQRMSNQFTLQFAGFQLLKSKHLVATYQPTNSTSHDKMINEIKKMVRRAADQQNGSKATRRSNGLNEECDVHGTIAYSMDQRPSFPHITIKSNASQGDLNIVNNLFNTGQLPAPNALTIRVNNITVSPTAPTTL